MKGLLGDDIHFGDVNKDIDNWRKDSSLGDSEVDPDDEELPETPEDVIAILGFDPKEE